MKPSTTRRRDGATEITLKTRKMRKARSTENKSDADDNEVEDVPPVTNELGSLSIDFRADLKCEDRKAECIQCDYQPAPLRHDVFGGLKPQEDRVRDNDREQTPPNHWSIEKGCGFLTK